MCSRMASAALVIGFAMVVPAAVFAQGSIGGSVRDASGGALPGVVVEAASPALIERVRTVTTDGNGQYLVVDLRPGTYTVTFTLQGFSVLKREGLIVSSGITLPVNAELAVSSLQETVTVTGESPVVDVQNTSRQSVIGHELLDALPRSQSVMQIAAALPGVVGVRDVGGSEGDWAAGGQVKIHGSNGNDQASAIDGMRVHHFTIGGSISLMPVAQGAVQEYGFNVSAASADVPNGGVLMNAIPRDGGNTFGGNVYAYYTGSGMTTTEMPEELRTRWGLTKREEIQKIYVFNPTLGGPIARDRLWFYGSYRSFGTNKYPLDTFHESDPTRPLLQREPMWTTSVRLTWQASQRNKVAFFGQKGDRTSKNVGAGLRTAESSWNQGFPGTLLQTRWTSPVTSRLLIEAGVLHTWGTEYERMGEFAPPGAYPTRELTTNRLTRRRENPQERPLALTNVSAAGSYVTGTHALKVGLQHLSGHHERNTPDDAPTLELSNGVPVSVNLVAAPRHSRVDLHHDLGVYAQDNWKVLPRVTLDVGLRFDWLIEGVPAQQAAASALNPVGARSWPAISNVPNWKDLNPRLGGVWDVFGNGRTAVKASATRFVDMDVTTFTDSVNPAAATVSYRDRRTWNDNGDRILQFNELGPSTNLAFGLPVLSVRPDPSLAQGWGKRGYNWEYTASAQHQLRPGLGLTVGYYRRVFGNLTWTNNRAITRADFTPFTIANPLGGERVTLYNLNPAKRGLTDNVVELAPDNFRVFDGLDVVVNGRFGRGGVVNGGVTMGRTATNSCTVWDPNDLRFCEVTPGFMAENQYKFLVSYPLPYGLEVSSSFRSLRGLENLFATGPQAARRAGADTGYISGNYTVTSAIAGIPLTNATITVPVVEPATVWSDRMNLLDARIGKRVRVRGVRLLGYVEVFNLFDSAGIRTVNTTIGPQWQRPTGITAGRMARVGGQIDF